MATPRIGVGLASPSSGSNRNMVLNLDGAGDFVQVDGNFVFSQFIYLELVNYPSIIFKHIIETLNVALNIFISDGCNLLDGFLIWLELFPQ